MNRTPLVSVSIVLAWTLACGGGEPLAPDVAEVPLPAPDGEPRTDPNDVPLAGYAYLPGPGGGAEGARFSRFDPGDEVFVGVDDANLRDVAGDGVVATLPLGTKVTIVEILGAPEIAIDRRSVWYAVTTADQRRGRLFGGLLTPFGGRESLSEREDGERGWAVTFSPEGKPRLRVDAEPGSDEAITLDLNPTERFSGGRMEAELSWFGDFEREFQVSLCRLDGGEPPLCSAAVARLSEGGSELVQATPPDPWKYAPGEASEVTGVGAIEVAFSDAVLVETLQVPQYMRGPDGTVQCYGIGRVHGGPYDGKELVSCLQGAGGKGGPSTTTAGRYLRDGTRWTFLTRNSGAFESGEVEAALVEKAIQVQIDATSEVKGLEVPSALEVPRGVSQLRWEVALDTDGARLLAERARGDLLALPSTSSPAYGLAVRYPDGMVALYDWSLDLSGWTDRPEGMAADAEYQAHTNGCSGFPETLINVEPDLSPSDLRSVGRLGDGTSIGVIADRSHPVHVRLMSWYDALKNQEEYARPKVGIGQPEDQLLASFPWLFVEDPWGRVVRLDRADLEIPAMCEPILYAYANPPQPVHIAPGAGLRFFATRPHGPNGWKGLAQPDGSVVIDGERWPELFWEGRSVWFAAPRDSVVVAPDDLERFLRRALFAQGLRGHEIDAFVDAWLPELEGSRAVRIGFHSPETIARVAPLDIAPEPEVLIRVLMDASFTEEPPDVVPELPERVATGRGDGRGLVIVEWGGVVR